MIETGAENLSDALDAYLNSQLTEIEMEDLSEKMVLDLTCDFVEMAAENSSLGQLRDIADSAGTSSGGTLNE